MTEKELIKRLHQGKISLPGFNMILLHGKRLNQDIKTGAYLDRYKRKLIKEIYENQKRK